MAMVVSIVIPVYNTEKYLGRCLDSVLQQTYNNWRAIIVDDGSTDQSGAIADAYQQQDTRFQVIHKNNQGQLKARLEGIRASNGDIVMFLDSDDYWMPHCLEKIVDAFNHSVDLVMFPARVLGENGHQIHLIGDVLDAEGYLDKRLVYETVIKSHDLNSLCLKAFKRTVFNWEKLNSVADMGVRIGEDKLMLLPLITEASKIYFLKDILYVYVHHDASISHYYQASKIPEMISERVFQETFRYLPIWQLDDTQHRRMLEMYYLRNLMSCYYKMRKYCVDAENKMKFKAYPWKTAMGNHIGKYLLDEGFTIKEKIKLIVMRLSA